MENMGDLELYKEIVEKIPGGFFVYHADGDEELVYSNDGILRIFGCDTLEEFKELTGYTFRGIVHPDDLEMAEESIRKQIGQSQHALDYLEYRIIRKDGSVRWVEDYGHFAHTERYGDVFYVFVEDATERREERMEQLENTHKKLKLAYTKEMQYRNALLCDSVAFFEANFTQNILISPVVQIVNDKQTDMFDNWHMEPIEVYSELIRYFDERRQPDDDKYYAEFFNAERLIRCYEKNELEQIYETWVTDSQGKTRLFRYTVLLVRDEETFDVLGLVLIKDLTHQMDGKTLLEIAFHQMESERIQRDRFLSDLSHNMRTPLNGIIGYTNVIQLKEIQNNPEKLNEYIERIRLLGVQLLNVVDGSLEYFKVEADNSGLYADKCCLTEILENIRRQTGQAVKEKNLELRVEVSQVVHNNVIADSMRLQDILFKLTDNAIKYTEPGGHIRLSVDEEESAVPGHARYHFAVKDDGIGMDKQLVEKIFEPFSSGHDIVENGVIGSGMGLAIVKGLVKMMEGEIRVESEPGRGSTFTVALSLMLQEDSE